MLDNEDLLGAQQVMRENNILQGGLGAPTCITDNVSITGIYAKRLNQIDTGIHASYCTNRAYELALLAQR